MNNIFSKSANYIYVLAVAIFSYLCYGMFYKMSINYKDMFPSDFRFYVDHSIQGTGLHRMIGFVFNLIYKVTGGTAGMVAFVALCIGFLIIANYYALKYFTQDDQVDRVILQGLSFALLFMGPIYVPYFHEFFYKNSFQTFPWHSPTQHAMLVFSVPALIFFLKMFENYEQGISPKLWCLTSIATFLSAFAKPSFALDLCGAIVVVFVMELVLNRTIPFGEKFKKLFAMGCAFIPAGLYFLVILFHNFGDKGGRSGSLVISIDNVLHYHNLFAAVVCGLAFPIVVWCFNLPLLKERKYKVVFWIFLMGVLQWVFISEDGPRAGHGNFGWGRQAGCYMLFISSLSVALHNWKNRKTFLGNKQLLKKLYFIGILLLLGLHICSQVYYFCLIYTGHGYIR